METDRVAQITQRYMAPKIAERILGVSPVMAHVMKNTRTPSITWRDRLRWKVRAIKDYCTTLWEAIMNRHICADQLWD